MILSKSVKKYQKNIKFLFLSECVKFRLVKKCQKDQNKIRQKMSKNLIKNALAL